MSPRPPGTIHSTSSTPAGRHERLPLRAREEPLAALQEDRPEHRARAASPTPPTTAAMNTTKLSYGE